jgi:hypothetical protein
VVRSTDSASSSFFFVEFGKASIGVFSLVAFSMRGCSIWHGIIPKYLGDKERGGNSKVSSSVSLACYFDG